MSFRCSGLCMAAARAGIMTSPKTDGTQETKEIEGSWVTNSMSKLHRTHQEWDTVGVTSEGEIFSVSELQVTGPATHQQSDVGQVPRSSGPHFPHLQNVSNEI